MAAIVVQLGLAMMPLGGFSASSGLTSLTTSGTSGSLRHADELSTTRAPVAASLGAYSRDMVAPADIRAMSRPVRSAVAVSSTMIDSPLKSSCFPAERAEPKNRIASTGNSRSTSSDRITLPTVPVAPDTPTRMGASLSVRTRTFRTSRCDPADGWGQGDPSSEPVDVGGQQRVADEGEDVDDAVRGDQWGHPLEPQEVPAEDQPHGDVAGERAEALIEVVRATDQGAANQYRRDRPADLAHSGEPEADDDHFLQYAVHDRQSDQHGHRPPVLGEVGGLNGGVDPHTAGHQVAEQTRNTDHRGQHESPAEVAPRPLQVEADPIPITGQREEIERQDRRHHRKHDARDLVTEIEPRTIRGDGAVDRRGLLAQRLGPGQLLGDRQDRVDRRLPQRDTEHQQHLVPGPAHRTAHVRDPLAQRDSLTGVRCLRAKARAEARAASRPGR